MKFGLFYEHQLPGMPDGDEERMLFQNALDQIELADKLGYDHLWTVEHHFLEEYSHSSAPEVFLGAAAQRTKNIRLGHGVMLTPSHYNEPARQAERLATLDLVSNGRVEWGSGESASAMEMEGFNVDPEQKHEMWREAVEQIANMMVMKPYPGYSGKYFSMPVRNVVPKPVQKPHPPMWVACSKRETIHRAARNGLGALAFAFVTPEEAAHWVQEYYDIIKSDECVPIGHAVNANVAVVSAMSTHQDPREAMARGLLGFRFFAYSLGYYNFADHKPGRSNVWEMFLEAQKKKGPDEGDGGIGTPDQLRTYFERYEKAGMDQVIFVQQCGLNKHEHICQSLELFGKEVLPEFKAREVLRQKRKQAELAPYIEAAMARKKKMPELATTDIPEVTGFGARKGMKVSTAQQSTHDDRSRILAANVGDFENKPREERPVEPRRRGVSA